MNFTGILIALTKLFSLLIIGFFMSRKGILDSKVNKAMTFLLVYITNPCLMLGSIAAAEGIPKSSVVILIVFAFGMYALMPLLAFIAIKLLRFPKTMQGLCQMLLVFGNTGFMALPILQTLYGDVSIFYINILNIPFNLLVYTYGVYMISKDAAAIKAEKHADDKDFVASAPKFDWKILFTPGVLSGVIVLILYFLDLSFPTVLNETFSYIGSVTPPLSMLLLGSILGEHSLKAMIESPKLDITLVLKMIILPVITLAISKLLFTDSMIIGITTMTFAMPCASMNVMLSKTYHANTKMASAGVVFSTIVSLVLIPLVYVLLSPMF